MNNHYHFPLSPPSQPTFAKLSLSFISLSFLFLLAICIGFQESHMAQPQAGPVNGRSESYIIQADSMETAQTAVSQIGGQLTHELAIINGVAADLTDAQHSQLVAQSDLSIHANATLISASAPQPTCTAYDSTDVTQKISGKDPSSTYSTINVPTTGTLTDINLFNLEGKHDRVRDLDFNLISPQGTEIEVLNTASCDKGDDDFSISLDDEAASGNFPCAPTDGNSYQPATPLSVFDGEESQGTWVLRIDDNKKRKGGELREWGLEICTLDPNGENPDPDPDGDSDSDSPATHEELNSASYAIHNYRDEFNTDAYTNQDGDTDWVSDWFISPDDDPRIGINQNRLEVTYFDDGDGMSSQRYVALRKINGQDTISGTLTFTIDYHFASAQDSFDVYLLFDVYHGPMYIRTVSGAGSSNGPQEITIDLAPYVDLFGGMKIGFDATLHSVDSRFSIDDFNAQIKTYRPNTHFSTRVNANQVHATAITGADVSVAVIDTGLGNIPNVHYNPYILYNAGRTEVVYDAILDYTETMGFRVPFYGDESGHGTHVSSIIASNMINNETGTPNGVAPQSAIVSVKAFAPNGTATYADVIRGVDWIVANKETYNIRVINASFFSEAQSYYWEDPLNQALMKAWQAGIVVVASAGNIPAADNHAMTIGAPGNIPYIITVGGMTDSYTPDDPTDDRMMSFSALGPTAAKFIKPDVVAPGGHIRGYMPEDSQLVAQHAHLFDQGNYFTMSGTSQSAAVVSGIVALMLEADPSLTPDDIKCRLMDTARATLDADGNLAAPIYAQGAGLVDAYAAVNSTVTGCANQGLDIAADLAGTHHYVGHVEWDDLDQQFVIYNDNGEVIDGVAWSGGNGFMAGGNGFMAGGNGFMAGGNGFMAGGNGFMAGGNGFMAGGNGFMAGGNGFMAGTTPWNASVTWSETPDFTAASASMNTWIEDQE